MLAILAAAVGTLGQDAPAAKSADTPAPMAKAGTFWYGIYGPDGKAEGYTKTVIAATKQGGIHVERELHFAFDGGTYEEERFATFDKAHKLTFAEFESGNSHMVAAREGKVLVGKAGVDDLRVEVTDDAVSGLGYVLAACMTLAKDATLARNEYNDSAEFAPVGPYNFKVEAREKVKIPEGEVESWKVVVTRKRTALTVWVNDAREMVQIDFGGGRLHKLHRASTRDLFKPEPAVYTNLEPDNLKWLKLEGEFPGLTVAQMFDYWTKPELITKWWPPKAEIEGKIGGKYELTWTDEEGAMKWQLSGKITEFEQNKRLGFTWDWTGSENPNKSTVSLEFIESKGGTKLRVTHGPYTESADDQEHRRSQLEGWQFFGAKLRKLKP
jgi:uncharacterized protein YndB with AHSA1/START domain